jgi:hypothetical protein
VKFVIIYTETISSYNHTNIHKELFTAKLRRWRHFRNVNKREINCCLVLRKGTPWCIWLRHCAKSRKIPDGVVAIFHWHNPSGRTMALGSTRPLTEMSTRNISWGLKAAGALGWQLYHIHVPTVMKSGSHNTRNSQGLSRSVQGLLYHYLTLKQYQTSDYVFGRQWQDDVRMMNWTGFGIKQRWYYHHICLKGWGNKYCYRYFRFKSWYGPAIQVQTLNGLKEKNSFGCKWPNWGTQQEVWGLLRHSKAWAWTVHPSTVKLVGVL